ncbi:MAG: hypothetical protein QOE23_2174, partial [Pseudonocardiales bacterium]|nr:hypothetical protein [Pseudonocardiales bacterium]
MHRSRSLRAAAVPGIAVALYLACLPAFTGGAAAAPASAAPAAARSTADCTATVPFSRTGF